MDFELTEEQQQMKMSVREFAEAEIAPHVMEWDETQTFPLEVIRSGQQRTVQVTLGQAPSS